MPQIIQNERKLRPERKRTLNTIPFFIKWLTCCEKKTIKKLFIKTKYYSGDMASIILVQRRIKYWLYKVKKMYIFLKIKN